MCIFLCGQVVLEMVKKWIVYIKFIVVTYKEFQHLLLYCQYFNLFPCLEPSSVRCTCTSSLHNKVKLKLSLNLCIVPNYKSINMYSKLYMQ